MVYICFESEFVVVISICCFMKFKKFKLLCKMFVWVFYNHLTTFLILYYLKTITILYIEFMYNKCRETNTKYKFGSRIRAKYILDFLDTQVSVRIRIYKVPKMFLCRLCIFVYSRYVFSIQIFFNRNLGSRFRL